MDAAAKVRNFETASALNDYLSHASVVAFCDQVINEIEQRRLEAMSMKRHAEILRGLAITKEQADVPFSGTPEHAKARAEQIKYSPIFLLIAEAYEAAARRDVGEPDPEPET